MGVKNLGLFLLILFLFASSLRPSQHPLVSASNQEIRGRVIVVNRRGGGGGGGHGGGGGSHSGGGGRGYSEGGGSNGKAKGLVVAGVVPLYATGALNHQNQNNGKRPHHRGSNGCTTKYVGLTQFVCPLLGLLFSLLFVISF